MQKVPLEEFCRRLRTDREQGLSPADAATRLLRDGPNSLVQRQRESETVKFLRQLTNLFALLLWAGAGLSFLAERIAPGEGNLYIGTALVCVVLLNGIFSYWQQHRAEQIMAGFRQMLPARAKVVRGGEELEIPAAEIVRGDVIRLVEGDRVPADARLFCVNGLKVDNSSLTGECEPQLRNTLPSDQHLLESRNLVFSGTTVQSGSGLGIVFAVGMKSQIGRTAELTQSVASREIPIRREIRHFTRIISIMAVVMGVVVLLVGMLWLDNPFWTKLIFAIGIIVANVPEGLLPTVTLCLSVAARRMAANNALIKNLESVETLGCTTVICTDKTGTLTQNRMKVTRLFLNDCIHSEADAQFERDELDKLLMVAALCNNARLKPDSDRCSGDPTEGALLLYCRRFIDLHPFQAQHPRLFEEPFTASTKIMVTINRVGENPVACLKGAPDVAFPLCSRILVNNEIIPLTEEHRRAYLAAYEAFAHRGERVLLFAWQELAERASWGEKDLPDGGYVFIGLVSMIDPPRPEVPAAVQAIRAAGIRVVMITGDYQSTAAAIGRQVGIVTGGSPTVIPGDQLAVMADSRLDWELDAPEVIFARTSPEQKLRIVQALQRRGEVVAVTGDGVNDSPALKQADIGVAMGASGTDVAREAADMVLLDDNFATLVPAVLEGRTIFDNLKKSIGYTVTHAVPEVAPFFALILFGIPLPLTVLLILAIDLGTDMFPAVSLAYEPPERDVMSLPPRLRTERLVSFRLLLLTYGINGVIEAVAAFYAYFSVLQGGGWRYGVDLAADDPLYLRGISAFFAAVVLCQIANALISRTHRQSLLQQGLCSNRLLLLAILVEIVIALTVLELEPLHAFFGNASLSPGELLLAWPFALGMLLLDEGRRFLIRRNVGWVARLTGV